MINDLNNLFKSILDDYANTCGESCFNGNIIIAKDMAKAYVSLRGDLVEKNKMSIVGIEQYHGLTVQPINPHDDFTILLNEKYIIDSCNSGNVDWVGTLVHEAVHVNDFKQYFNIIQPESYDELYKYDKHRLFLYWTEFRARAIGHYFLRKYTLNNFKDEAHLQRLLEVELPYQAGYMIDKLSQPIDTDSKMYVVVHFLGRLATWEYLYPNTFNEQFISLLFNQNPWMKDLFYFLKENHTLEKVYVNFNEMEKIIENA